MGNIVSIFLLVFILGIIIFVHELGHFYFARRFGVHVYEFSLGMGPILFSRTGKDNIKYNIRAIPIGGFVNIAGEVYDDDDKIDKSTLMCNKKTRERLLILASGVINNFILAIFIFFVSTLIWGASRPMPVIKSVKENYPFYNEGIKKGDVITKINGKKIKDWDTAQLVLLMKNKNDYYTFEILNENGIKTHKITPVKEKLETGEEVRVFGIELDVKSYTGVVESFKFSLVKFKSIIETMILTLGGLFSGKIGLNSLAGPVGMYKIVDTSKAYGIATLMYLTAFLSVNVGFINILPFPAFDGGRIVFIIIEKIRKKPINPEIENIFHFVGFILLILLMIYVSIQDVIKLF